MPERFIVNDGKRTLEVVTWESGDGGVSLPRRNVRRSLRVKVIEGPELTEGEAEALRQKVLDVLRGLGLKVLRAEIVEEIEERGEDDYGPEDFGG